MYAQSLNNQIRKIENPELTPSGRMISEMKEGQLSFFEFSMQQSRIHRNFLSDGGLDKEANRHMQETSMYSTEKQKRIEAADTLNFDPKTMEQILSLMLAPYSRISSLV